MAEVRDGWDTRLHRAVAVKLLYPGLRMEPENRARFEVEARAAAALTHPHIIAVHDSGEHEGAPYIVMERLSGRTLADAIEQGPLPQRQVRVILDNVLSALSAAHAAGVLHRDIKPANILFTASGDVKVADFGIAKSAETPHTLAGQIVGTMAYLSADRIAGGSGSATDDVYALGVVGYEALTGRRAFPQQNLVALARAISEEVPPPLTTLRPDVDPALAAVIERSMARDPRWRFGSAAAMRSAIAGGPVPPVSARPATRVMTTPITPPSTVMVSQAARPRPLRKILVPAAVVVAVALALVLAALESGPSAPAPASTGTTAPAPPPTSAPPSPARATPSPAAPPPVSAEYLPPGHRKHGDHGHGRKHKGGNDDE
jgi:eukaryotic-like serine/threonine-protein kinase